MRDAPAIWTHNATWLEISTTNCSSNMQDEVTVRRLIIVPLKGWNSSNIWGKTLKNKNYNQEEIQSRLKSGNGCYNSVQNLLSSSLLSKNLKIKIYRTIILPIVLYGCETWSLTLREERRLRVFENRMLSVIFGPKREDVIWSVILTQYCSGDKIENEMGGACSAYRG